MEIIIAARSENFVAHLPLIFDNHGTIFNDQVGLCGIYDETKLLSEESILLDDNIKRLYDLPADCFMFPANIAENMLNV